MNRRISLMGRKHPLRQNKPHTTNIVCFVSLAATRVASPSIPSFVVDNIHVYKVVRLLATEQRYDAVRNVHKRRRLMEVGDAFTIQYFETPKRRHIAFPSASPPLINNIFIYVCISVCICICVCTSITPQCCLSR